MRAYDDVFPLVSSPTQRVIPKLGKSVLVCKRVRILFCVCVCICVSVFLILINGRICDSE